MCSRFFYAIYDEAEDELVRTLAAKWFIEDDGDMESVEDSIRQLRASLASLRDEHRADIRRQFEAVVQAARR